MNASRASPAFSLVVLVTLGLFGLTGVVLLQPDLISGLLGHDIARHTSQHFRLSHHRVHDLTFSFVIGTAAVGMFAQLRKPAENAAGQLMALIPGIALGLAFVLSKTWIRFAPAPIFAALTLAATVLHPTARDFLSSPRVSRVNTVMLALLTLAAVPLVAFASTNIGLQRTATNDHAALGHYGFMAAFSFTVIGAGAVASVRPPGWRLTAWLTGVLPALLGLASLLYPNNDSSVDLIWALVAIAWGVVFIAAAELFRSKGARTPLAPDAEDRR